MTPAMRNHLTDVFRSAVEAELDPATASADWLARDIDPRHSTAVALLADPDVSIDNLKKAKDAYKTMRILGETSADRRLAARLYAAAIAAGFAHHHRRISRQSTTALRRGLQSLAEDNEMAGDLRRLAGAALVVLDNTSRPA